MPLLCLFASIQKKFFHLTFVKRKFQIAKTTAFRFIPSHFTFILRQVHLFHFSVHLKNLLIFHSFDLILSFLYFHLPCFFILLEYYFHFLLLFIQYAHQPRLKSFDLLNFFESILLKFDFSQYIENHLFSLFFIIHFT